MIGQHRLDIVRIESRPGKGRGLYANRFIAAGETIERSPVIVLKTEDTALIEQTVLNHYVYKWVDPDDSEAESQPLRLAMVLGQGSLFNHSKTPNADFQPDYKNKVMKFIALKDIAEAEEICIDYGIPLWFEYAE